MVAFGGGEGLPGSREIAGDGGAGKIRRPRSEIRMGTRGGQGATWLHGYIVTWGSGSGGSEAEAEEEGVCDGADRENRAGVFADEIKGLRKWLGIAVGFDATGFEFFQENGFTGVLPITAGNEVMVGDGIEVPIVGFHFRGSVERESGKGKA